MDRRSRDALHGDRLSIKHDALPVLYMSVIGPARPLLAPSHSVVELAGMASRLQPFLVLDSPANHAPGAWGDMEKTADHLLVRSRSTLPCLVHRACA